jgi:hypothetical protein
MARFSKQPIGPGITVASGESAVAHILRKN